MELRNVTTFLRVAELQSFSKAAGQLGYSQAAVTVQIKQLEHELGTQLFERIGRRIQLTEQGIRFIPYAKDLLVAAQKAHSFLGSDSQPSGKLRIGTAESLSISVLPPILLEFSRQCPQVETSIRTGRIPELFEMVRQNDVDLLYFLDKSTHDPEWVKVFERPEPIVFVAPAGHPLVGVPRIPASRLLAEPMALTERGISYRYDLEQMLAARSLELHPFLETGNTHIITRMLLQGAGISFLPQYAVQRHLDSGALAVLDVDLPRVEMRSQLIYHKNKWITPQIERFLDLLQRQAGPHSPAAES